MSIDSGPFLSGFLDKACYPFSNLLSRHVLKNLLLNINQYLMFFDVTFLGHSRQSSQSKNQSWNPFSDTPSFSQVRFN
jgi:hypothetical protein